MIAYKIGVVVGIFLALGVLNYFSNRSRYGFSRK